MAWLRVLACLLLILLGSATGQSSAPGEDTQAALMQIHASFTNSAEVLKDWNSTGSSPCTWSGVECDPNTGEVLALMLSGLGLTGPLPREGWDQLASLALIDLSFNDLTGSISNGIKWPSGLQSLALSANRLNGTLPASWDLPPSLTELLASNNRLSGELPQSWQLPPRLVTLFLQNNSFTGLLPTSWSLPDTLEKLDLCTNQLSGTIPADWRLNEGLLKLTLCDNQLQGSIPAGWRLPRSLQSLYLYANFLTGPLPASWALPESLTELALSQNLLSGSIPADWRLPEGLQTLFLMGNRLSGTIPAGWKLPPALKELKLFNNRLSGEIPAEWQLPDSLQSLELDGNQLTSFPPDWQLPPSLLVLDLTSNRLGPDLPTGWALGSNLTELLLSNNSFSGELPPDWQLPDSLERLVLGLNELSGPLPANWSLPSGLKQLGLFNNSLTGTLPPQLNLPEGLQTLELANNVGLRGSLPSGWAFPSLKFAALWGCNFTGPLPSWQTPASAQLVVAPQAGPGLCGQAPSTAYYQYDVVTDDYQRLDPSTLQSCPGGPASPPAQPPAVPPSPAPEPPPAPSSSGSSSNLGLIIGVVASCVALVAAALVFFVLWRKRKQRQHPVFLEPGMSEGLKEQSTSESEHGPMKPQGLPFDVPKSGWAAGPPSNRSGSAATSVLPPGTPAGSVASSMNRLGPPSVSNGTISAGGSSLAHDPILELALRASKSEGSSTLSPRSTRSSNMGLDLRVWEIDYKSMELVRQIGQGSFGRVYVAKWRELLVAVKILLDAPGGQEAGEGSFNEQDALERALTLSSPVLENLQKEAGLMAALRHPNIVQFLGVCAFPPCVVTEYCSRGSLTDVLKAGRQSPAAAARLDWGLRLRMMMDTAKGMLYLHHHNPPIIHRDLKSPNLLVDSSWRVKVTDFNLSKILEDTAILSSAQATNPRWLAPEVLSGQPATMESDVYSFGVICWEVLTWTIPFSNENHWQLVRFVAEGGRLEFPEPSKLPGPGSGEFEGLQDYIALVTRCWAQDPKDRPSFQQIVDDLRDLMGRATRMGRPSAS